jgi:hypothetical protein
MAETLYTARCPLCGGPNGCALSRGAMDPGPCWCARVSIPAELLARVPEDARGAACVCARCAGAAREEP